MATLADLKYRLLHLRRQALSDSAPADPAAEARRERLRKLLVCPVCRGELHERERTFLCGAGHGPFPLGDGGVPRLVTAETYTGYESETRSGVNWLKSFFKQFPQLYYGLWHVFCPVLMVQNHPRKLLRLVSPDALVVDLGSGPSRLSDKIINVDIFPFPGVDIVADALQLPFQNASVDAVVTEALLEHVPDPSAVAAEISRILKPGGFVFASAPFLTPYHASPDDFGRWTVSGLKELFGSFQALEAGVRSGPWSALLVFLAYWLGNLCSLGSRRLAPFMGLFFMLILGPFKIFDFIFGYLPGAEAVSAHLYIIARKPAA